MSEVFSSQESALTTAINRVNKEKKGILGFILNLPNSLFSSWDRNWNNNSCDNQWYESWRESWREQG